MQKTDAELRDSYHSTGLGLARRHDIESKGLSCVLKHHILF